MKHKTIGRRFVFIIAAGWLLALAIGFVFVRARLAPPRCLLTAATLAITNDPTGMRHGVFGITNVGRHGAFILGPYGLENRSGKWNVDRLPFTTKTLRTNLMGALPARKLSPGASCVVEVPLPCDDPQGRALFWYLEEWPPLAEALHHLSVWAGLVKEPTGQLFAVTDWASPPAAAQK